MNECERIHPFLRGYLQETLSASQRRVVARHLNLCASARKEIEKLRQASMKSPSPIVEYSREPWDIKILRWFFKTPASTALKPKERLFSKKGHKTHSGMKGSIFRPILGIAVLLAVLVFCVHMIPNARYDPLIQDAQNWTQQKGWRFFGTKPSLELVLDLSALPHWSGDDSPVAFPYREMIGDEKHFNIYWQMLEPGVAMPTINFNEDSVLVVFLGPQTVAGDTISFKRDENYTDRTILWYEEIHPASGETASTRPWVMQVVPKPSGLPVSIQPIR